MWPPAADADSSLHRYLGLDGGGEALFLEGRELLRRGVVGDVGLAGLHGGGAQRRFGDELVGDRVQVGRFSEQQEAERLREELASTGLSPRVVRTQKGGTTVYRVQVGTFRQKENADRQMEVLKSRSYEPYLADEAP